MTYYFNDVYIENKYSLLASDFNKPIVRNNSDKFINDYYLKQKTIELAESKYQSITINGLLEKSKLASKDISLLVSSDLQNQLFASTFAISNINIPFLGIYSACASFAEGLIIASMFLKNNERIIVTTSGHNLVSEKQFRFPVEYGAVRKMVNSSTISGSVSALISNNKSNIRIESATIGKVVNTSHRDANDMGSAMAPACANTIYEHLKETNRKANYYDLILTGDLGEYGIQIMKKYYKKVYKSKLNNVIDAGNIIFEENSIYAGGSGPACAPLVLFDYILKDKKYKKILFVCTGSLHSSTSSNLSLPMPAVAHAVSLEAQ